MISQILEKRFDPSSGHYVLKLSCGHSKMRVVGRATLKPSIWAERMIGTTAQCEDCESHPVDSTERRRQYRARYREKKAGEPWVPQHQKRETIRRWRAANPEKSHAHGVVAYALKLGKLTKPLGCEECGRQVRLEGHHEDYDKPLSVKWLCRRCHSKLNGKKHCIKFPGE